MTYEDYMPELEPIIDSVCVKFAGAKTDREDLKQEAHLVLIKCLDKLQAAPGDRYKPLARMIVTNRFHEILREEHKRGQWAQCELSDAVLSMDCGEVTSFDDEYFKKAREKRREYYLKNRDRILQKMRERRAVNMAAGKEYSKQYYQDRRDEINARSKQYYQEHKEAQKAAQINRYHSMDEEQKAKRKEYNRQYYEAHKEQILENARKKYHDQKAAGEKTYTAEWLDRHPDYMKEWREKNPEKQREYEARRSEASKERKREYQRKYAEAHKEESKARYKERWQNMSEEEKERRRVRARERYRRRKAGREEEECSKK